MQRHELNKTHAVAPLRKSAGIGLDSGSTRNGILNALGRSAPLLMLVLGLTGCSLFPQKPSEQTRRSSLEKWRASFSGDLTNTALHPYVYFLFQGSTNMQLAITATNGSGFKLTAKHATNAAQGLAIGIEPDGYLLTAAHVLGPKTYALGWFDGKFQARQVRVVHSDASKNPDADWAVIKVEATLDHCAVLGELPVVGDPVCAVVCYRQGDQLGGNLGAAAGLVERTRDDPAGGPLSLIETDLPLWHGDSGGPLLSRTGQLIGINSAIDFRSAMLCFSWKQHSISVAPRRDFLLGLIRQDRAAHPAVPGVKPEVQN